VGLTALEKMKKRGGVSGKKGKGQAVKNERNCTTGAQPNQEKKISKHRRDGGPTYNGTEGEKKVRETNPDSKAGEQRRASGVTQQPEKEGKRAGRCDRWSTCLGKGKRGRG